MLTGQTEQHLVKHPQLGCLLHKEVVIPLERLAASARAMGFDLAVASGFRSFERQCAIWNDKVTGRRAVLDDDGQPIELSQLDDWGKVQAILRWSALPGASRHHWGTDLDVYDRCGLSADYPSPQLTADECRPGGVFGDFHIWLDAALQAPHSDFRRPYAEDRGGVGCERWHISFRPVAEQYARALDKGILEEAVRRSDLLLGTVVLAHLDEIYDRFVTVSPD
ncbi:M15 family metallopeptidase [Proteobacteria bacterium 005FR1]|nr:M15 family metallopeptidase [Proteobacteria bacterium 005FR1]